MNVGSRQEGRERGDNVLDAAYNADSIGKAIADRVRHGRFRPSYVYGDGQAGARVAERLAEASLTVEKRITY